MNQRSPVRAREIRDYRPMAEQFLRDNPDCQFPLGCDQPAEVVHHTRSRRGWRLLYVPWWRASCNWHNEFAENETGAALECGWLQLVEGAA